MKICELTFAQFEPPCTVDDSWIDCSPGRRILISFVNLLDGAEKFLDDFFRARKIANLDWLNISESYGGQILGALDEVLDRIKIRISSEREQQFIRNRVSNEKEEKNFDENFVSLTKCLEEISTRTAFERLRIKLNNYFSAAPS